MSGHTKTSAARAATVAAFGILTFLLLWKQVAVTPTFDEMLDAAIVKCYQETLNPFDCSADITQTRLPFYIHAAARAALPWFNPIAVDRTVSAAFVLAAVYLIYRLVRREWGDVPAALFVLLAATNATVLSSGRMSLTHANAIFAFFTVASIYLVWKHSKSDKTGDLLSAAACFGLSVASSLNGVLTGAFFIVLGRFANRRKWSFRKIAVFFGVAVVVFFAASPIHAIPEHLINTLFDAGGASQSYPKFNYLGTGAASAPWWFSLLLFTVKISPWWAMLTLLFPIIAARHVRPTSPTRNFLATAWCFIVFFLIVKSVVFRYDAPHHQIHVQLLALVLVAVALTELWSMATKKALKTVLAASVSFIFVVQSFMLWAVFPNTLFFGAQYGVDLVGEFYGPASIHCQDMADVRDKVHNLLDSGEEVRSIRALCWACADGFKATIEDEGEPEPSDGEFHVMVEGITAYQMKQAAEEHASMAEVMSHCRLEFTHRFPFGYPAYEIYDCPKGTEIDPRVMVRLQLWW